jgi:hypothetical protein
MQNIDAAIMWDNGKAYFFGGSEYVRYDIAQDRADGGYPLPIAGHWPGLWPNGIDAAVNLGNGKAYFFKGSDYVRYDMAQDKVDDGYPLSIAGHWPGLWPSNVRGGINWGNGKLFFFHGSEYVRYDIAQDKVDAGYPLPIAGQWPGLFDRDIEASLLWNNGKAFFFRSGLYSRYDVAQDRVDPGYPLPVKDYWPGLLQTPASGPVDTDGNRLLTGGTWNGSSSVSVRGGQIMHFHIKNLNVVGVSVKIHADRTNQTKSMIILPSLSGDIIFQQFGSEPMGWTFNISTDSDAMIVAWQLFSSWLPSD